MTRDSSPPEAVSRSGAAGTPAFGASMSSTRSAPVGPTSSRGSRRTSKAAPSMARASSSSRTRSASRGAASALAALTSLRQARSHGQGLDPRGLRPLDRDLGVLEPLPVGAAALRVLEHGRDAAAVLSLQLVVLLQALLDLLEAPGLGLERLPVAAQLGAEVLGLDPDRREALRDRVELGIDAGDGPRERLCLRKILGDPALARLRRDRLGAAGGRRHQAVKPPQALALREKGGLLVLGGANCLDLVDLEGQQIEVAVAGPRLLAQLLEPPLQLAGAPVRRAEGRPPVELLGAAEAVEQVELGARHGELAVLVLAEEGDERAAQLAEVGSRGRAALHERARAPFGAHPPGEDHLVGIVADAFAQLGQLRALEQPRWELERALDVGVGGAGPDDSGLRLAAQQQVEGVGKHGLARAGLSGDHREPVPGPHLGILDQQQVLDAQLEQHTGRSTSGRRRSGPDVTVPRRASSSLFTCRPHRELPHRGLPVLDHGRAPRGAPNLAVPDDGMDCVGQ